MADKDPKDPVETEDEAALAADTAAAAPEATEPVTEPEAVKGEEPADEAPVPEAETDVPADLVDEAAAEADEPKAEPAKKPAKAKAAAKADEPKAEAPAKAGKAAKADKAPAAERTPKRAAGGKVLRDKHGRPVVDGPVVQAHAKYVRTSARKARLVCDHIRGKSVDEAVAILAHTPRAVAEDWEKLLKSAVANAEHNHELLGEDLKIHAVFADEGPTLKRFRPRAMGRATKIRKRTSHLTIQLTPKES